MVEPLRSHWNHLPRHMGSEDLHRWYDSTDSTFQPRAWMGDGSQDYWERMSGIRRKSLQNFGNCSSTTDRTLEDDDPFPVELRKNGGFLSLPSTFPSPYFGLCNAIVRAGKICDFFNKILGRFSGKLDEFVLWSFIRQDSFVQNVL